MFFGVRGFFCFVCLGFGLQVAVFAADFNPFSKRPDPAIWSMFNKADCVLLPGTDAMANFINPGEHFDSGGVLPKKFKFFQLATEGKNKKRGMGKTIFLKPTQLTTEFKSNPSVINPFFDNKKVNISNCILYLKKSADGNFIITRIGLSYGDMFMMSRTMNCSGIRDPNEWLRVIRRFTEIIAGYEDNTDRLMDGPLEQMLAIYVDSLLKIKGDFSKEDFENCWNPVAGNNSVNFGAFIKGQGNDYSYDQLSKDESNAYFEHYEQTEPTIGGIKGNLEMNFQRKYPLKKLKRAS